MLTVILKPQHPKALRYAVEVLKAGGVVVYPTESSYALGCAFGNRKALHRIFELKQRMKEKTLPVIVGKVKDIEKFALLSSEDKKLIKKFMPGPLSLKVPVQKSAPKEYWKPGIVFRISANKFAQKMAEKLGRPVVSTSANLAGKPALYSGKEVMKLFAGRVDLIVDSGNLKKRKASTIYDTRKKKVLREGPVTEKAIQTYLNTR